MANAPAVPNEITLNGQKYILMALNWKQLKALRQQIILINSLDPKKGMFTDEEADAILKCVTAALQRARSDITAEFVEEHLDLTNVGDILKMTFGQKVVAKDASPGETGAALSTS